MADKLILFGLFLLALVASPVVLAASSPVRPGKPVLVITSPWQTPNRVITAAGGQVIGPETAPLALFAASDDPNFELNLKKAGALAVLDGTRLAAICGV